MSLSDKLLGDCMSKKQSLFFWSLSLGVAMASYQNCSPTKFSQIESSSVEFSSRSPLYTLESSLVRASKVTSDIKEIDWNQNGITDIVFSHSKEGRSGPVYLSEICMDYEIHKMNKCFPLGSPGEESVVNRMAIADLDQDGRLDVVEFKSGKGISSSVVLNKGYDENTGPLYVKSSFYSHSATNNESLTGDLIDYDHDGDLDIAFSRIVNAVCLKRVYEPGTNECQRYGQKNDDSGSPVSLGLEISLNKGGSFRDVEHYSLPNTYQFDQEPNTFNKTLKIQSFKDKLYLTNDRFEDHYVIAFPSPKNLDLRVIEKSPSHREGNYWTSEILDIDEDGFLEAVHLCSNCPLDLGSLVYSIENSRPTYSIPAANGVRGLTLIDLNNDGLKDLVASRYDMSTQTYSLLLWEKKQDFTWEEPVNYQNIENPISEMGSPFLTLKSRSGDFLGLLLGTRKEDVLWTPVMSF